MKEMIYKLNDTGKVIKYETKHTKTLPPKLFKLSSAQQVAGKSNINPKQTLEAIQSLYDKQYMSYPRTSCEYLASGEDLEGILHKLFVIDELKPFISKITKEDIDFVIEKLTKIIERLRSMSPLYEDFVKKNK